MFQGDVHFATLPSVSKLTKVGTGLNEIGSHGVKKRIFVNLDQNMSDFVGVVMSS